jgi:hypothetical protein
MVSLDYLHEPILSCDGINNSITSWYNYIINLPRYFLPSQWTRVLWQVAKVLDHKIAQDCVKISIYPEFGAYQTIDGHAASICGLLVA